MHRCELCQKNFNERRYRANPINWRTCGNCNRMAFHRGPNADRCFKCWNNTYVRQRSNTRSLRAQSTEPRAFNSPSSSQRHFASPVVTPRNRRNFKTNIRHTPMSQEEFERAFPDEEPPPKYNQSGQEICLTCGTTGIRSMHRCLKCYNQRKEAKYRADPGNYRKCRICKNDKAWHRGELAKECTTCYHQRYIIRTSKRPHTPKKYNDLVSRTIHGVNQPLSPEEFQRRYVDHQIDAFITPSGQRLCGDCRVKQAEKLNRCMNCYNSFAEERRRNNPDFYCYCSQCREYFYFKLLYKKPKRCQQCNTLFQKDLSVDNQASNEQALNEQASNEQASNEELLVIPKKEHCNKFRVGWSRIRRQIIMKRFYLNSAASLRIKRKEDRQKRREERQSLIQHQPNRRSSSNVVFPSNLSRWIPEGWRKGQCKVCRVKVNDSNKDHSCPNYCRTCGNRYLSQRICIACKETKRHHGKGMCMQCYNDVRSGRVQKKKANNEHTQMEVNIAKNVSKQAVSNAFKLEPEVIDLTMSDDE